MSLKGAFGDTPQYREAIDILDELGACGFFVRHPFGFNQDWATTHRYAVYHPTLMYQPPDTEYLSELRAWTLVQCKKAFMIYASVDGSAESQNTCREHNRRVLQEFAPIIATAKAMEFCT